MTGKRWPDASYKKIPFAQYRYALQQIQRSQFWQKFLPCNFLRHVRLLSVKSSFGVNTVGINKVYRTSLLLDHGLTIKGRKYSTEAYIRDDAGQKQPKAYLDASEWLVLADKSQNWTIQEGDYLLEGEIVAETETEIVALRHYKVQELAPIFDKDGSIHHFEVQLV